MTEVKTLLTKRIERYFDVSWLKLPKLDKKTLSHAEIHFIKSSFKIIESVYFVWWKSPLVEPFWLSHRDNHLHTDNSTSIETFRWQICDFLLKTNNVFQCYEVDNDVHSFTRQISMVSPHNEKIKTLLVLSSIKKIYARQCYRENDCRRQSWLL